MQSGEGGDTVPKDGPAVADLLAGIEAGEVGVWRWNVATGRLEWSPNLERIHRLAPGTFTGTFAFFQTDIHPDDRARVASVLARAMEDRGAYQVEYRLPEKEGVEDRWLEARGTVIVEKGTAVAMTGICQDITARKRTEREFERQVRLTEALAELGLAAMREQPLANLLDTIAREVCRLLGCEFCKILELQASGEEFLLRAGHGWKDGLVGVERVPADLHSQAGFTLTQGDAVIVEDLAKETRFSSPQLLINHHVISGMSVIIGGDDRPFGILGAHSAKQRQFHQSDVDFIQAVANIMSNAISRRLASDRQTLLMRELRHRVGNLLTLVISLFNNSVRGADNVEDLSEKFIARVMSLSRAHTFISYAGWTTASLGRLVREVLEPYLDRIEIEGPDVRVQADAGFALSIALHELASNAARYGGLATAGGALGLSWRIDRSGASPLLVMDWIEGGVAMKTPNRRGFGTRLIETVVRDQIGGQIALDYRPDGLSATLSLPFDA